jgi:hypothetical protein
MKRLCLCLAITLCLVSLCFVSPLDKAFASSISDNSVITLSGSVNQQNELIVQANLTVNTGISGMTLELIYDKTALSLSSVVLGSALASLDPIYTGSETVSSSFKFNYLGQENDFSTGKLFTLTFELNDGVKDGSYVVSLRYTKDKDVTYYDSNQEVKTKNLYIDNAEVAVKNSSIIQVTTINSDKTNSIIWLVLIAVCVCAVVVTGVLVVLKLLNKRKDWKKI